MAHSKSDNGKEINPENLKCSLDNWDVVIWQHDDQSTNTNVILHNNKSPSEQQHSDSGTHTQLYTYCTNTRWITVLI